MTIKFFLLNRCRFVTFRSRRGMSLAEVIVGVAIFVMLAFAIFVFEQNFLAQNRWMIGSATQEDQIRLLFRAFVGEVRSASTADSGAYVIESAGDTSFIFFSDTNHDGSHERIRYFVSGTDLKKGVIKPSGCPACTYPVGDEKITTVATDLTSASTIFFYYDQTYNGSQPPLTQPVDPSLVRLITIKITTDPAGSKPPPAQTFETSASIRNLRQF